MGVGITVEHLNAFYGKTQALFDINLAVRADHATALIGPSGCGKSTFIRCLNRMHETIPEARVDGSVRIGDISVYNGTSATQLRRRVGMVFQKPNPFPTMSIYDNVAAGLKLNGFRKRKLLDEVVEKSSAQRGPFRGSERFAAQEIRRQPLRRPAAAALHCPRPCGSARGPAHG